LLKKPFCDYLDWASRERGEHFMGEQPPDFVRRFPREEGKKSVVRPDIKVLLESDLDPEFRVRWEWVGSYSISDEVVYREWKDPQGGRVYRVYTKREYLPGAQPTISINQEEEERRMDI
jgi:hypothetical protein